MGCPVLCKSLVLYYTFKDPKTPTWAKTTILGALGYLVSLVDAIPDIIPVVGYTDDLGVLAVAVSTIAFYIKEEHKEKAHAKAKTLINSCSCKKELEVGP